MISDILVKEIDVPLNEYYICYFDVLGYKSVFDESRDDHKKFLLNMLSITSGIKFVIQNTKTNVRIQYRTYSDNFLLYFEKNNIDEYSALKLLCSLVRRIQIKFIVDNEIIIRGGITVGEFYADENIVFGQGLIKAVELENKIAKNPRIVIDERFHEPIAKLVESRHLVKDADGQYYVNYFYDVDSLKLVKSVCVSLINKNCKFHHATKNETTILQEEKRIAKYLWILIKFNEACRNTGNESLQIEYLPKINEKILKLEISCTSQKK